MLKSKSKLIKPFLFIFLVLGFISLNLKLNAAPVEYKSFSADGPIERRFQTKRGRWIKENNRYKYVETDSKGNVVPIPNLWVYDVFIQWGNHVNVYRTDENGFMLSGLHRVNNDQYFFNNDGTLQTGIVSINNQNMYFNPSGRFVPHTGSVFPLKGKPNTWVKDPGSTKYTYYDANGDIIINQFRLIGGERYFFTQDGSIHRGFLQNHDNNNYYFDENGKLLTGWFQRDNHRFYADPTTGALARGVRRIEPGNGSNLYFFDTHSQLVMGSNHVLVWHNNHYHIHPNGYILTGRHTWHGHTYFSNTDGQIWAGWINGGPLGLRYHYAFSGRSTYGQIATGQQTINGHQYLFDREGNMQVGWQSIVDYATNAHIRVYYDSEIFESRGQMYVGARIIDGHGYYFDRSTGQQYINRDYPNLGGTGHVNAQGYICDDIIWEGNSITAIDPSGNIIQSGLHYYGDDLYSFSNGHLQQHNPGWVTINGTRYYSTSGSRLATGPTHVYENGVRQFLLFDHEGRLNNHAGMARYHNRTYFINNDGEIQIGAVHISSADENNNSPQGFYLFNADGTLNHNVHGNHIYANGSSNRVRNSVVVFLMGGNRAIRMYVDAEGNIQNNGFVRTTENHIVYAQGSGALLTNSWLHNNHDNETVYLNSDGILVRNATMTINGVVYHFDNHGIVSDDHGLTTTCGPTGAHSCDNFVTTQSPIMHGELKKRKANVKNKKQKTVTIKYKMPKAKKHRNILMKPKK